MTWLSLLNIISCKLYRRSFMKRGMKRAWVPWREAAGDQKLWLVNPQWIPLDCPGRTGLFFLAMLSVCSCSWQSSSHPAVRKPGPSPISRFSFFSYFTCKSFLLPWWLEKTHWQLESHLVPSEECAPGLRDSSPLPWVIRHPDRW